MKIQAFLRIGVNPTNQKIHVSASTGPDNRPFIRAGKGGYNVIPTIFTELNIEIPDEVFLPSAHVIKLDIPVESVQAAAVATRPKRYLKGKKDRITVGSKVQQVYGFDVSDAVGTAFEVGSRLVKVEFPNGDQKEIPRTWLKVIGEQG